MINLILQKTNNKELGLVTFLNPYSYILARKNKELFDNFDTIYVDGIFIVNLFKILKIKRLTRNSFDMTSLAPKVFEEAIQNNKSIYFVGAKEGIIDRTIEVIRKKYSKLKIVGYRNGYFNDIADRDIVIDKIINLNPDIVICGMGTPLQEKFLMDLRNKEWLGKGYTCGGFLHQTAKTINYYPKIFDKLNIRWIYRIIDEPHLFYRYFVLYPKFLLVFFKDFINFKTSVSKY